MLKPEVKTVQVGKKLKEVVHYDCRNYENDEIEMCLLLQMELQNLCSFDQSIEFGQTIIINHE